MKFFKNMLVVVILCAISSFVIARVTNKPTAITKPTSPAPTPTEKPVTEEKPVQVAAKTFKQLIDEVKGAKGVWVDSEKIFNPEFEKRIASAALVANLDADQLSLLLQMARDYHAMFTGNQEKDRAILNNLARKRADLIEWLDIEKQTMYQQD
jgi:hypothetical protein